MTDQPLEDTVKKTPWYKPTWKKLMKGTLLSIAAAGVFVISSEICAWNWRSNHRKQFGTVANPKYAITATEDTEPKWYPAVEYLFNPRAEHMAKRQKRLEVLTKESDSLKKSLPRFKAILEQARNEENCEEKIALLRWLRDLGIKTSHRSLQMAELSSKQSIQAVEECTVRSQTASINYREVDFNPDALAQELFKKLTGKAWPINVQIVHEKQRKGVAGYHNPLEGKISSKGLKNVDELNTLLHEAGHVVAQHGEENLPGIARVLYRRLREIITDDDILEEACAYAFVDAGCKKLAETDKNIALALKLVFEASIKALAQKYFDGDNSDEHFGAAAWYLATRNVAKKQYGTFNRLATVPRSSYSGLGKAVHEELKNLDKRYKTFHSYTTQMNNVIKAYQTLLEETEALSEAARKFLDKTRVKDTINWSRTRRIRRKEKK